MVQKQNKAAGTTPPEIDARFQLILTLITLLKSARHKAKKSELVFMMVNQTFNLTPYRHCVFWEWNGESVDITAASGLVQVDPSGPYAQWLRKVILKVLKDRIIGKPKAAGPEAEAAAHGNSYVAVMPVTPADCEAAEKDEWPKWVSTHALLIEMKDEHGEVMGGLWIDREQAFGPLEMAVLEDLADGYADLLQRFGETAQKRRVSGWKSLFRFSRSNAIRVMIVIVAAMFIPVRMSATAPAEIVARKPEMVSVPFDGVIESVDVMPGQAVKKGDVLARLDATILANKREIAASEAATAEIALRKTERESLTDRSKLADIAILKSQVEQKAAEARFAAEMLERAEIKAERDGIVIYADPSSLRGKPVATGEQIMLLADPADSELLIRVPVAAMIEINEDVPAKFFLNAMPLGSRKATYESIGYQATPDPDGLLTYKVRARFADEGEPPRIGWTGTGKVYGEKTILGFNILRRPVVTLRRKLGL